MTRSELCDYLGYTSVDAVHKLARGHFIPPADRAALIATLLGKRWTAGKVIDAFLALRRKAA